MTQNQKNMLAFGLGFTITGTIISFLVNKRLAKDQDYDLREQEILWIATGIINERTRRGEYLNKNIEQVMEDLEFERIRIANDEAYNKIDRARRL